MGNSEEQSLSGQESLEVIHKMINQAKGNFRDKAFYFLLWGWVVLAGSLGHYILIKFSEVAQPELAWLIIFVGVIWSVVKGIQDKKKSKTKSYTGQVYGTIWIVFLVNYFILLFFIQEINYFITPLILLLAAGSTFISGSLMRFKAFQYGAVGIWMGGVAAFLVALPYQLLITAVSILVGYLIPGYLLKFGKNTRS